MIRTSCEKCVFNNNKSGEDKRPLCSLGKYEKFESLGCMNEDFTLTRLCTTCRDEEWAGRDSGSILHRIARETENIFTLLIVDHQEDTSTCGSLKRLRQTLENRQSLNPRQIILVYTDETPLAELSEYLKKYVENTNIKYSVIKAFPDEGEGERELVDLGYKSATGLYYTVIKSGETLPVDFTASLYHLIEFNLTKLAMILPLESGGISGLTVLRGFHALVNGNFSDTIENKIAIAIENEGNPEMVKTWAQVKSETSPLYTFLYDIGVV